MKFSSFTLEKYKGISEPVTLKFENENNRVYCIVGNNEAGKTTILQGIELIGSLCQGNSLENGKLNAIRPKGTYFDGDIKFSAGIQVDENFINQYKKSENETIAKLTRELQKNKNKMEIAFVFSHERAKCTKKTKTIFVADTKICEAEIKSEDNQNEIFSLIKDNAPEILYYEDFVIDVPDKIIFPNDREYIKDTLIKLPFPESLQDLDKKDFVKGDFFSSFSKYMDSENQLWIEILNDINKCAYPNHAKTFEEDIVNCWNDDQNESATRLLKINGYLDRFISISKTFLNKPNANIKLEIKQNSIEKGFISYSLVIEENNELIFKINDRSKGLRWFFTFNILTKIRSRRNTQSGRGVIFLLDEPANNLHINLQETLIDELNELCKDNITAIYSTHSPSLIDVEKGKDFLQNTFLAYHPHIYDEFGSNKITCTALKDVDTKKMSKEEQEEFINACAPILLRLINIDTKPKNISWKEFWNKIVSTASQKLSKSAKVADDAMTLVKFIEFVGNFLFP